MEENAILQFQADKYMMFLLVIAMESSLLHCSTDVFSKVNETRIKLVSSYPSGHVEVRCPRGKKKTYQWQPPPQALRFSHARGERETSDRWWTARDHGKGTDGRRTPARSCVVFLAKKSFSWHGPIFGLFKSWKRSILVAYCCKHCKLWVDRWMAQNFKTWGRNNRQAAKESDSAGFLRIEDL